MRKKLFFRSGFTLIESLVVIVITVGLLSSLMVYTRGGEGQILFMKEQATLVGVFMQARSFALDAYQPTLQPSPGGVAFPVTERVCAWGVHVDPALGRYILFMDIGSVNPQIGCSVADRQYTGSTEDFQIFEVDARLNLKSCVGVSPQGSCQSADSRDILFAPPTPKVYLFPDPLGDSPKEEFRVDLSLADGSGTSVITVTKGGSVTID